MNKLVVLCCVVLSLIMEACGGSSKQEIPAHILPESRFTNLLTDVRLLEGAYAIDHQRIDSSNVTVSSYYDLLLKRYALSREQYLESYAYYAANPEAMLRIETKVSEKLDSMQRAGTAQ